MFDTCGGEFKIFDGNNKIYDSRLRFRCNKIRENMKKMHLTTIFEENIKEHKKFLRGWE